MLGSKGVSGNKGGAKNSPTTKAPGNPKPAPAVPRPDQTGHARNLPTKGHAYEPPKVKGANPTDPVHAPKGGGYIDKNGDIWKWSPDPTGKTPGGGHWDVQHPDGSHTNVKPDGSIKPN